MRSHVIKIIEPCAKTSLYLVVKEDANRYDWKIFRMDNEVGQFFSFSSTVCKNTLTREEKLRKRSTRINYAKAIYTLRYTYLFRYIGAICNKSQVSLLHVSRLYNTFRCISRFDATLKNRYNGT